MKITQYLKKNVLFIAGALSVSLGSTMYCNCLQCYLFEFTAEQHQKKSVERKAVFIAQLKYPMGESENWYSWLHNIRKDNQNAHLLTISSIMTVYYGNYATYNIYLFCIFSRNNIAEFFLLTWNKKPTDNKLFKVKLYLIFLLTSCNLFLAALLK